MWVVMRGRESVEDVFFFFLPPSICFFKRDQKRRCVYGSGDGKELEKCREFFFSVFCGYDRVSIYTRTL